MRKGTGLVRIWGGEGHRVEQMRIKMGQRIKDRGGGRDEQNRIKMGERSGVETGHNSVG